MRAVGYGFVGFALGCLGGFWLGLMLGLIYAELASVSCFNGLCGYVAVSIGALGAALAGIAGGVYGLRRGLKREEAAAF
jgi:hypothetical protein